jgi:hypothetical protein
VVVDVTSEVEGSPYVQVLLPGEPFNRSRRMFVKAGDLVPLLGHDRSGLDR